MITAAIPKDETERLAALYALRILDTEPEERFDRIARIAVQAFELPIAYIALVDSDRQWFKSSCGLDDKQTTREVSFCSHTILQEEPLIIPDAAVDPRFHDNPLVVGKPYVRFYAGQPLATADGHRVGTLCIADHKPRDFRDEELAVLHDLARLAEDQLNLHDVAELQEMVLAGKREAEVLNRDLEVRNCFIEDTMGCFLTEEVASSLLRSTGRLELGGAERMVSILMSDLRGFTPMAERLEAEQVVGLLNHYFGAMVAVIEAQCGTVDKFIGDAIMALFGAPVAGENDAARALACAIEMQLAMSEVNADNRANGLPEIAMGIGVDTGNVIAGTIGSERRMNYSVIGNAVNLASRLESTAMGGQILVSQRTLDQVAVPVRIDGALKVKVKGFCDPVSIFDIGGIGGPYDSYLPEDRVERVLR